MRKPIKPFTVERASLPARARKSKAAPPRPSLGIRRAPGRPMSENATRGSRGLSRRNSSGGKGASDFPELLGCGLAAAAVRLDFVAHLLAFGEAAQPRALGSHSPLA